MRLHPRHRVDLAAELRHEEAVHDTGGRQLEADRRADRHRQLIDARNALVGVDEQPFPVERDHLDPDGRGPGVDRLARIQLMGADPGDPADQEHRHGGDRPYEQFETARIFEIGQVAGAPIGRAKPEGDAERGEDRRDHDRQHDAERVEQYLPLGGGDGPLRAEHAFRTAGERRGADQADGKRRDASLHEHEEIGCARARCARPFLRMAKLVGNGLDAHHAAPSSVETGSVATWSPWSAPIPRIGMFQEKRACTVLLSWGRSCSKNGRHRRFRRSGETRVRLDRCAECGSRFSATNVDDLI